MCTHISFLVNHATKKRYCIKKIFIFCLTELTFICSAFFCQMRCDRHFARKIKAILNEDDNTHTCANSVTIFAMCTNFI